jgi:hypothetical protein
VLKKLRALLFGIQEVKLLVDQPALEIPKVVKIVPGQTVLTVMQEIEDDPSCPINMELLELLVKLAPKNRPIPDKKVSRRRHASDQQDPAQLHAGRS